jgi:hypothetical protein
LLPADFWLFSKLKSMLKGKYFWDIEDIKSSVKRILTDIPVQVFKSCLEQWPKHWEHYKELGGDSFKKFWVANIYSSYLFAQPYPSSCFLFKITSSGKNLLCWAQSRELVPISGHQHQHKMGYINQSHHKTSARVKKNMKNIKKLQTHET